MIFQNNTTSFEIRKDVCLRKPRYCNDPACQNGSRLITHVDEARVDEQGNLYYECDLCKTTMCELTVEMEQALAQRRKNRTTS